MCSITMPDLSAAKIIIEKLVKFILLRIGMKIFITLIDPLQENLSLVRVGKKINQVFLRNGGDFEKISNFIISIPGKRKDFFSHPNLYHSSTGYGINNSCG